MSLDEQWIRDLWHQLGGREKVNGYEFAKLVAAQATAKEREAIKSLAQKELRNTMALASMPPQSSAAWNILQGIEARGQDAT